MLTELKRLRALFSRKEKFRYLILLVLMLFGALLDIIGIGAIPALVAVLAAPDQLMEYPLVMDLLNRFDLQPGRELLLWGSGLVFLTFLFKNAYLTWMYHYQFKLVESHRVSLADRLFSAYMLAPYSFIMSRNTAELMRNVQTETLEIIRGILLPALAMIMGAIITLFTVVLLFAVTPWVAMVGLVFIGGGSFVFLQAVKGRLKDYGETAKVERKELLQAMNQGLGAFVDARVLGREAMFIAAFRRSLSSFANVDRLRQIIGRASPHLLETISVTGMLVIILMLAMTTRDTESMFPILALFGVATIRLRQTIAQIVSGFTQVQFSLPAIGSVIDDLAVLEKMHEQTSVKNPGPGIQFDRAIELDDVSYIYPGMEIPALNHINIRIKKGESIAFVGVTGSGKSTLVSLILGLLTPSSGEVKVDGQRIQHHLRSWLDHVGYIPQSVFLVDDSIKKNIAFGLPEENIHDGQLMAAIEAAQLDDFVNQLPNGVETIVGERGIRLSGGQRQRIGLARALYHNPSVLVMDEATSALDNNTENLVMEAIKSLQKDHTVIMIAHRITTVQNCDRIYVVKDGKIQDSGSYTELLSQSADFRKIAVQKQS